MDRFFINVSDIDLNSMTAVIKGEDVKHISKVLRYEKGDKIEVSDGNNNEYICEIEKIEKEFVQLKVLKVVDIKRESNTRIRLYQGLPKNTKMEIILQKLTECGVDEIVLVNTKRTVVKLDDKKNDKKFDRWERIIYEAAKQSKRGIIPKLRGVLSFKEAIEDMKKNDFNFSPYESEKSTGIIDVLRSDEIKSSIENKEIFTIGIFIGPEGGFADEENEYIKNNGIESVSMGPRIFRTETASIVATSLTLYELGDIGGR